MIIIIHRIRRIKVFEFAISSSYSSSYFESLQSFLNDSNNFISSFLFNRKIYFFFFTFTLFHSHLPLTLLNTLSHCFSSFSFSSCFACTDRITDYCIHGAFSAFRWLEMLFFFFPFSLRFMSMTKRCGRRRVS